MKTKILCILLFTLLVGMNSTTGPTCIPKNMVLVEGGEFMMGSETGGPDDEKPVHDVTLDTFYIGKCEVTQQEWQAVMQRNPSFFTGGDLPVEQVSWYDAVEYCNQRSKKEGLTPCYSGSGDEITCDFSRDGYRLPTEAEWEYAARGGQLHQDFVFSGSNNAKEAAWFEENSAYKSHTAAQKKPNELGIYDMSGNVWEWCADWYEDDYYQDSPAVNPTGPAQIPGLRHRSYRGGGFGGDIDWLRSTARFHLSPHYSRFDMGFRVVKKASGKLPTGMIQVAGGVFRMGNSGQGNRETPPHKVMIKSFYIGKYEVTQEEWLAVSKYNPSFFTGAYSPVEGVSWYDAVEYCNKKSREEGLTPCYSSQGDEITCNFAADGYRLPTEAEWEYAARGGRRSGNYKFSGSNDADEVGWYNKNGFQTQPQGLKKANELGIYDMSGNVFEWCEDWYDHEYYKNSPHANPTGPKSGFSRMVRGGGCFSPAYALESTAREKAEPFRRVFYIGFRLVRGVSRIYGGSDE